MKTKNIMGNFFMKNWITHYDQEVNDKVHSFNCFITLCDEVIALHFYDLAFCKIFNSCLLF